MLSDSGSWGAVQFGDDDDDDVGYMKYAHNGDFLRFGTAGNTRFRIDADGVKFNGDTAASNALDDYEEGSFTPTLPSGGNMGVYNASYTKVGRLVSYWIYVYPQSVPNDSSFFTIGGFPFTSSSTSNLSGSCVMGYGGSFNWTAMGWFMSSNSTTMNTYYIDGTSSGDRVPNSAITGATRYLALSGQYYT